MNEGGILNTAHVFLGEDHDFLPMTSTIVSVFYINILHFTPAAVFWYVVMYVAIKYSYQIHSWDPFYKNGKAGNSVFNQLTELMLVW